MTELTIKELEAKLEKNSKQIADLQKAMQTTTNSACKCLLAFQYSIWGARLTIIIKGLSYNVR